VIRLRRRVPAKHKSIKEITSEDVRARIVGRIIDKRSGSFIIDDGTGVMEVVGETDANTGETVRAIVRIFPLVDGYETRAEVVTRVNDLDIELYRKSVKIAKSICDVL